MLRFDLNISILLKEVPFIERFEYAARLGFGAVEFWWPVGEDLSTIAERVRTYELDVALMNFDAGTMAAGERGFLNDRSKRNWFRAHVPLALEFAKRIGCPQLNALVGNGIADESREAQLDCVRENLAWTADLAASAGLGIVVETLNRFENPRYLLSNTHDVLALLTEINRPNLKYQYDCYHMQRMEGNLIATLREHIAHIGHVQIADSPDRHEPGTGEIHYAHVLAALEATGYADYIGLEYNPSTTSEASLAWLPKAYRRTAEIGNLHL